MPEVLTKVEKMILRSGVDLLEIQRLEVAVQRYGPRFLNRIFTPREQLDSADRIESLAVRFAAKEAVAKALGCGIGKVSWLDIEVLSAESRQPFLQLHGSALQESEQLHLTAWSISLSHTSEYAVAFVVAIG
ncbi:MAG: holo-ACP synthase [Chloroflexota bacterium]